MREPWPPEVEAARLLFPDNDKYSTRRGDRTGAFRFNHLRVIANDAKRDSGWLEHVSVSVVDRCPTWDEMCKIKNLFWREDEWVVQFHPAISAYINNNPFVLHLWRPTRRAGKIPTPPQNLV